MTCLRCESAEFNERQQRQQVASMSSFIYAVEKARDSYKREARIWMIFAAAECFIFGLVIVSRAFP